MLFAMIITGLTLYLYCYYGKHATDSYASYADCLFNSKWLALPVNLQKYYILMIAHAQKPLFYQGYGIVKLDLETFSKVSTFKISLSTLKKRYLNIFET